MPYVVIDAITRWLDETVQNMDYMQREGFMRFLEETMKDTFEVTKNRALEVIRTGEPRDRIPINIGGYALRKAQGMPLWSQDRGYFITGYTPTSHGLGILSGGLYNGVKNTPVGPVKTTRGKEVRIDTKFKDPDYISDVHDGKAGTAGERPFFDISAEMVDMILAQKVEEYLSKLNITAPPQEFISTLISRSPMKGVVVY